jgi:cobalt-zinc-cadmium efflux system protein
MSHDHSHQGHTNETRLGIAALLTGVFMLAEIAGGLISGSLALLADAGHMLTDFAALALAWFAFRLARRPADWQRTYGYDRFQILVAFANGLALFAIAAWILIEAWQRLAEPRPVLGGIMLAVASAGLAVNLIAFWLLHGADQDNLNVRGATVHVMGDLLGSIAAIVAAGVILTTGWTPIDPLLSVLVAVIILRSAWHVVREAGHILLENAPRELDSRDIARAITSGVDAVLDVHHIHLWAITQKRQMITLHVKIAPEADGPETVKTVKFLLHDRFGLDHATVEIEYDTCPDAADTIGKPGTITAVA